MKKSLFAFWAATFVFLFPAAASLNRPATISAQEIIEPDLNEVTQNFPSSINFIFSATIDPNIEIESAMLRYGTIGLDCSTGGSLQQLEVVTPSPFIFLSWEWDLLRTGGLPPGVTVWWEWELTDTNDNRYLTERKEYLYVDDDFEWQTISRDGVTVYWHRGDRQFGEMILSETEQSLNRIAADVGVDPLANTQVWVYPTGTDVQDAILNVPEWTGGVAFPRYGVTAIGVSPGEDDWAAKIIPHELMHLLIERRIFNCLGINLPTWLNEGLARFAEPEIEPSALENLDRALNSGELPPLRSLQNGFSAYGNAASLSYTQSASVVTYMISEFGAVQMDLLLETMQSGSQIDDALEAVYGFDTDGLDVVWRAGLGVAATPTAAADAAVLASTPTVVPTLALGGVPVSATETPTATATPSPSPTVAATQTAVSTSTATAVPATVVSQLPNTPMPTLSSESTPTQQTTQTAVWPLLAAAGLVLSSLSLIFWLRNRRQ